MGGVDISKFLVDLGMLLDQSGWKKTRKFGIWPRYNFKSLHSCYVYFDRLLLFLWQYLRRFLSEASWFNTYQMKPRPILNTYYACVIDSRLNLSLMIWVFVKAESWILLRGHPKIQKRGSTILLFMVTSISREGRHFAKQFRNCRHKIWELKE